MSMKKSDDTIGNRTRDITACSAVPQPNAPPRDSSFAYTHINYLVLRYGKTPTHAHNVYKYLIIILVNTVCLLHVSATLVAILREVYYTG
jgi:hypothetical protein